MIRFAVAVLAMLAAFPALASPPPLPLSTLVISPERAPPGRIEASERVAAAFVGDGWIAATAAPLTNTDFAACDEEDAESGEACARKVLKAQAARLAGRPPFVVIIVDPGPGSGVSWTCVGPGGAFKRPDRQVVIFDPDAALSTVRGQARREAYDKAVGCILAAGSESGW